MGIEDPGWGRIIIVIFFIAILLGFLYFSKNKGKNLFSHLSGNEFLKTGWYYCFIKYFKSQSCFCSKSRDF